MKVAVVALAVLSASASAQRGPNVDVWVDNGGSLRRGEVANVHYTADSGSYVTVVRFNTDGEMTILAPRLPNSRSRVSSAAERLVTFPVDAASGVGAVFAVASRAPFDFSSYRDTRGRWITVAATNQRTEVDDAVIKFAKIVSRGAPYSVAGSEYQVSEGRQVYATMHRDDRYDYDDGYGYGYGYADGFDDAWFDSQYWGRSAHGSRYWNGYGYGYGAPVSTDPRFNAYKHCADGALVPWTASCATTGHTKPRPGNPSLTPRRPVPPRQPFLPGTPMRRGPLPGNPTPPTPPATRVTPPTAPRPVAPRPVAPRPVTPRPPAPHPQHVAPPPKVTPPSPPSPTQQTHKL